MCHCVYQWYYFLTWICLIMAGGLQFVRFFFFYFAFTLCNVHCICIMYFVYVKHTLHQNSSRHVGLRGSKLFLAGVYSAKNGNIWIFDQGSYKLKKSYIFRRILLSLTTKIMDHVFCLMDLISIFSFLYISWKLDYIRHIHKISNTGKNVRLCDFYPIQITLVN